MNNIKISNVLNSLPLIFEKNIGQHDEKVQFALNKKECTTFFNDNEIILSFRSNEKIQELKELENSLILNEEDKKYIYISGHMQYGDSIVSGNKNRTVTTKSLLWNRTRRRRYLGTGIGKPECRLYLPDSRRPQGYTMGHDAPVPLDRL